jgi:dTDP-4-dehydrorhamnose reductase
MPKILITGSSGFLGTYLLRYAPVQYKLIAQYRNNLPKVPSKTIEYLNLDLTSQNWNVLEKMHPDVIIHTAAMASIDQCESQQEEARAINFTSTLRLAGIAAAKNVRLIFLSSDVIFDGRKGQYSESDQPLPLNVYARTKVDAEKEILKRHKNTVVVRPGIFYGQALNTHPSYTEIMLNNLHDGKQVYAFSDQYRTPIYVKDLANALWELVDHSHCGILHIGGPQKLSRLELGTILCEVFSLDENLLVSILSSEARLAAPRPLDCSLDSSLAASILKTEITDCRTGLQWAYR